MILLATSPRDSAGVCKVLLTMILAEGKCKDVLRWFEQQSRKRADIVMRRRTVPNATDGSEEDAKSEVPNDSVEKSCRRKGQWSIG